MATSPLAPTVALEGAEGHFCCRSLRRKHIDPFDVSRDGKGRKKCGFRPFLWKYTHGARERAAQNQKKNAGGDVVDCFNGHRLRQWLRWNAASVTLFLQVVAGVRAVDQLRYVAESHRS